MSGDLLYLDSSALVKLVLPEAASVPGSARSRSSTPSWNAATFASSP